MLYFPNHSALDSFIWQNFFVIWNVLCVLLGANISSGGAGSFRRWPCWWSCNITDFTSNVNVNCCFENLLNLLVSAILLYSVSVYVCLTFARFWWNLGYRAGAQGGQPSWKAYQFSFIWYCQLHMVVHQTGRLPGLWWWVWLWAMWKRIKIIELD